MVGRSSASWLKMLAGILFALTLACTTAGCGGKGLRLSLDPPANAPKGNQYGPFTAQELGSGMRQVRMQPQLPADPPFTGAADKLSSALSQTAGAKAISYTAGDLVKDGAGYDTLSLPQNRMTAVDASAIFSPVCPPGAPAVLDQLAYATYEFTLSAYDGPPTIGFTWDAGLAPLTEGGFWTALANRERGRWDWFSGPQDTVLTLASLQPYIEAGTDRLLLVVLALGDQSVSLRQLNIGAAELRATGAIMEPGQLVDNFPEFNNGKGGSALPSVDLGDRCSPIRDQGEAASSTAFAIADGAYNFELNRIYGAYGWDFANHFNLLSPKYMYLETGLAQGYGCPDEGRITGLSIDWLQQQGCATEQNAPYINLCDADWGQDALDDAALLNIAKQFCIDPSGTVGVDKVKTLLEVHQVPLILRINVDPGFFAYHSSTVWNFQGPVAGTQALLIVGYDDALQAFKVRNSWGTYWGDGGYCWIGYDTFVNHAGWAAPWCWVVYDDYDSAVAARFCSGQAAIAPPTNVQASDGAYADHVALTWDKSAGATGYSVYRDDPAAAVATLGDVDAWDDTAVDGYCHTYWVQAIGTENSVLSTPDLGFFAQAPQINSVAPLHGQTDTDVQFTSNATGSLPMQYAWSFGGGASPDTSTEAAPVVTLAAAGSYNCSLDVTNDLGTAHFDFVLDVTEGLYLLPDPADPDWSVVTGAGTKSQPFVLDNVDMSRVYNMIANTHADGSGEAIDPTSLEWNAFPPFGVSWDAPGQFHGNTFTSGYIFAMLKDPPNTLSNNVYIEIHNLP